ncbi:DUF3105 domain-containing protein [Actinomadura parmotrematis]|uniref:DUF3105 domain-containing protein n=1 Tax=Actinomadura parmotrematis TaxID=2864039 RepID=A0ABS7G1G8_9ACTN|nr:DUF3105 domain-containing protein [Actinomadura parmotrematis]MBW8486546.1 DUF3105 domain-containing protein [Actinomadura parmotrematis]
MSKSARNRARNSTSGAPKKGGAPRKNGARSPQKNVLTQRQTPWGGIVFFTAIGLVAAVAITFAFLQSRSSAGDGIEGLITKDGLGRDHTTAAVKYDSPPMGGSHDPTWQNCDARVYGQALRNENAVHALEHGAVWITYRPDLAADQREALAAKVRATDYSLMSPYPGLDSPVVLSAWGRQVKVGSASDPRVDAFLRAFVKGPQTPEPGAACTGGKDTP